VGQLVHSSSLWGLSGGVLGMAELNRKTKK
jgi:hypothetical protein